MQLSSFYPVVCERSAKPHYSERERKGAQFKLHRNNTSRGTRKFLKKSPLLSRSPNTAAIFFFFSLDHATNIFHIFSARVNRTGYSLFIAYNSGYKLSSFAKHEHYFIGTIDTESASVRNVKYTSITVLMLR